jgi:hypothetical protein
MAIATMQLDPKLSVGIPSDPATSFRSVRPLRWSISCRAFSQFRRGEQKDGTADPYGLSRASDARLYPTSFLPSYASIHYFR